MALVLFTGCSEAFSAAVLHMCEDTVEVVAVEVSTGDGDVAKPRVTAVAPNTETEVWGYCCEPGVDGTVIISIGEWQQTFEFDRFRDNRLVEVPLEACPLP